MCIFIIYNPNPDIAFQPWVVILISIVEERAPSPKKVLKGKPSPGLLTQFIKVLTKGPSWQVLEYLAGIIT